MRISAGLLLVAGTIALPIAAHAAPVDQFTLTWEGTSLSFQLPASPTPNLPIPDAVFEIATVDTLANGTQVPDLVGFFTSDNMGGMLDTYLNISPDGLNSQQYFTGSTANPTFVPGTYTLVDPVAGPEGQLVIAQVGAVAATPEPPAALLLATGVAVLGMLGWRRRTKPAACQALPAQA